MTGEATLFEEVDPEFEESIRIDRQLEGADAAQRRDERYERYLDRYHLTEASREFLVDLFGHIHDENPAPDERNHWLYGYYGSGKSHLLTALDLLLDTRELEQTDMESVWQRFDSQATHTDVGDAWQSLHDDVVIVPLSINLLRYQGVREQSFSEIILQSVYKARGLAERLDVAFFEEEFKRPGGLYDTRHYWEDRNQHLNEILEEKGVPNPDYSWDEVRDYQILSDIVLGALTERATGMRENLHDIQNQTIGQELAVKKLEAYREELDQQFDRTVKLVLLMDEVTLFIGGDYQRLSELNALAESISDVGGGDIISVVTAQSKIEDVQPGLATKQLDFGILKDRFPQQYALPSHHVGEIVQQRLLAKSGPGSDWVENEALSGTVHPGTMLVFTEVGQNTEPPLDDITNSDFVKYYPLLPYQPALFLEILSSLRNNSADATKSIFSGTARAILSIVAGLREQWTEKAGERPVISLVDFYDLVQYELEDIISKKTAVIDEIEENPDTTPFDTKVAKAVLLLSYVPDMIPQSDANLAVAIMDDLDGQPRATVRSEVRESLEGNLEKYIRDDTSTEGNKLRLTDREEQRIISEAHEYEADPDWDDIIETVDNRLWEAEILPRLDLPQTHTYNTGDGDSDDGDAYPVGYTYTIDGQDLETGTTEDAVFDVEVLIRGIRPDVDNDHIPRDTLCWFIETEALADLQSQLVEWWALVKATQRSDPPESIVRDIEDAAEQAVDKLVASLEDGSFKVEASEFDSFATALADCIDEAYPSYFHPELGQIDESHLTELRQLEAGEPNPEWATEIGVPPQSADGFATFGDLAMKVRELVGGEVQDSEGDLDVATILDRMVEAEPLFGRERNGSTEPAPATLAVLWGLCRAGVFQLKRIDGDPVPVDGVLSRDQHTALTLAPIPPGRTPKDVFVDHDIIEPTATGNQGYVEFDAQLADLNRRATSLAEDVTVKAETTFETAELTALLENLATTVEDLAERATNRREGVTEIPTEKLADKVEAAHEDAATLEAAEQHWEERAAYLFQLEGLVRLGSQDIPWLDEEVDMAIETLAEQLTEVESVAWWTADGWRTFVRGHDAREDAIDALETAWAAQQTQTDIEALQAALSDHAWLVDPNDTLPLYSVHEAFRVEYLDTLRTARRTFKRGQRALTALTLSAPGTDDEATLTQALGVLDGAVDWAAFSEASVSDYRERLDTLDRVVGDADPDEVDGIGLLHDDADALQSQIENLDTADGVPELAEVDGVRGVIIR